VSPLPNTKVIPAGWAEHHRPTANGTMTEPCVIKRVSDGPPPYPKPVDWVPDATVHETVCRVQELKREGGSVPAEQPTTERQYLVTIPVIGAPAFRAGERGDVVHTLGRQFRIASIMFGSLLWELDFVCVDNLTQQNPA
jgi:hypothetical protein